MPIRQDPITTPVSATLMAAFGRTVSANRWGTYLRAAGHSEELALRLYLWNAAIGQSFHFVLQMVEVALRNVSNDVLCDRFGPDWCRGGTCREVLGEKRCAEIDKAITRLARKYHTPPSTDQIVASLTLGFWAAILHRNYHLSIWAGHEGDAFPNMAVAETMITVSDAASDVQDLRNRIFHHEPLIGRNLSGDYGIALKLVAWICRDTRDWTQKHASVPAVLRLRPR